MSDQIADELKKAAELRAQIDRLKREQPELINKSDQELKRAISDMDDLIAKLEHQDVNGVCGKIMLHISQNPWLEQDYHGKYKTQCPS